MWTLVPMGNKAVSFHINQPSFKNKLWQLAILTWESMESHKMWNIWKMADVEGNGLGTRGPRQSICRVLFGSGHLSSVWVIRCTLVQFSTLRFLKGYCSHSFHPISTKIYGNHGNRGKYRLLPFLVICQMLNVHVYGTLKISHLSYNASIHKAILISPDKWSSRAWRPMMLLFQLKSDRKTYFVVKFGSWM